MTSCFSRFRAVMAACIICLSVGRPLTAQKNIGVAFSGTAEAPTLTGADLNAGALSFDASKGIIITVSCAPPFDCTTLKAVDEAGKQNRFITSTAETAVTPRSITVSGGLPAGQMVITVSHGGHEATPKLTLQGTASGSPDPAPKQPAVVPLKLRVRNKTCANIAALGVPESADFVLWLDGELLSAKGKMPRPGKPVVFYVIGDKTLLRNNTKITRTSAIRTIAFSSILGAGADVSPTSGLNRQGAAVIQCDTLRFESNEFASGAAQIGISVLDDDGITEEKNTFDFNVATLYTGAYAFGGIRSNSSSPTFGKVYNGADTVVSKTGDTRGGMLYVLTYTPFVWGSRDPTQWPDHWYQAVNPMLGVVLNDVSNNGIFGVSVDLHNYMSFTAGVHAARVQDLDPAANLAVGKSFDNRGATVPTTRAWTFNAFYGISFDLQGALGLLKMAIGAAPAAASASSSGK